MTLAPLLSAPAAVQIHVATILPAFVIGTWLIFFSAKGARDHRLWGKIYLALMTVTSIAAFFIRGRGVDASFHGFSPIHLFIPLTLSGVVGALYYARRHDIPRHRKSMLGVYIGGLLIAGSLTLLPGRIMHAVVLGN